MATKKITFDPDADSSPAANFTILGGSNFHGDFEVVTTSNTAFDFSGSNAVGIATTTGWTGSSQMTMSTAIGSTSFAAATFVVGFTSAAGGKVRISLGGTTTQSLTEGRYVYDFIVGSGATIYTLVNGNILVRPGVSSISTL